MPFDSQSGLRAFQRLCGLHRARYWREQGFPNLVLARKARWRKHVPKAKQRTAKAFSPFAMLDDLPPED